MQKRVGAGLLGVLLLASSANAGAYLNGASGNYWADNFESGKADWTTWNQTGNANPVIANEDPDLGTNAAISGVNAGLLHQGGASYNGGAWAAIDLTGIAVGTDIYIDGWWKSNPTVASYMWAELIVRVHDTWTPTNGSDIPTGNAQWIDGSITNGELVYKHDTWASTTGWSGRIRATNAYEMGGATGNGYLGARQATWNRLVIVLKSGNGQSGSTVTGVDWDDIYVTPEPATLALLALGFPLLRRRRR